MKFIILYISYLICNIASSVMSTKTETSTNTSNGIFGSFKMFNYKTDKVQLKVSKVETKVKANNNNVPPPVSVGDIAMDGAYKGIQQSLKTLDNDSKTPGNIELGPAPYFTGWIQYFKFSSNKSNLKKPTTFFKNMQFFEQKKLSFGQTPVPDFTKKDADGQYILIPNPTHFYVTMFERSLNIANSKEVSYNNF